MPFRAKRVYDAPAPEDGARVLVDRLWPRGLTKEAAALDDWAKAVAPSDALRKWFHAHMDEWTTFQARYARELETPQAREAIAALRARGEKGRVTLLYASKQTERNNATELMEILRRPGAASVEHR